jgi:cytochrome c
MLFLELTMKLPRRTLALGFAAGAFAAAAHAADQATPEEAKALAERAAAHFKEVGPAQAIADFNSATGGYVDRELFVVVYDPDHRIVGSYGVPVLRNKDATTLKDVAGKEFGKEIIDLAKSPGSGWVEYRMTNPVTKKVGLKRSWVIGLGDYVLFVGAFES